MKFDNEKEAIELIQKVIRPRALDFLFDEIQLSHF